MFNFEVPKPRTMKNAMDTSLKRRHGYFPNALTSGKLDLKARLRKAVPPQFTIDLQLNDFWLPLTCAKKGDFNMQTFCFCGLPMFPSCATI